MIEGQQVIWLRRTRNSRRRTEVPVKLVKVTDARVHIEHEGKRYVVRKENVQHAS